MLLVAQTSLPAGLVSRLRHVSGVVAAVPVDAGRIKVNGVFVNVLGVNPAAFRPFAAGPTARSAALWQNVAAGGIAVSYTMGHQDRVALNKPVQVDGARSMKLPVAGFGTVGIGGVDAVVSGAVGRRLGLPAANAIVLSAPQARLDRLMAKLKKLAPRGTAVAPLVTQVIMGSIAVTSGAAGAVGDTTGQGPGLTAAQTRDIPGRGREPARDALRVGRRRPANVRLLRPGAVVDEAGRHPDATGGGRPGKDRTADQAQ